jgi:hypothetical protein
MSDATYDRWCERFPAMAMSDPRDRDTCEECQQTFAWYGCNGLCGWCYEERSRPRLRLVRAEGV